MGLDMSFDVNSFDEIAKRLEGLSASVQRKILRRWQKSVNVYIKALSKEKSGDFIRKSGYEGKAIYRVYPDIQNQKSANVKVWGNRPNVASDPAEYPRIPKSGFAFGRKMRITLSFGSRKSFVYSQKTQEHYASLNPKPWPDIKVEGSKEYYFTYNGLVWKHAYSREKQATFPVFSMRSIPKLVEEQPDLSEKIFASFREAAEAVISNEANK